MTRSRSVQAAERYLVGDITLREVAAKFGLNISTVFRRAKRLHNEQCAWPEDEVTC